MLKFIKKKIQNWLGITKLASDCKKLSNGIAELEHFTRSLHDLAHVGVDVHFKSPHMILVYTKLNGGQIHHIDAHFKNMRELREFIDSLKYRFQTRHYTEDLPRPLRGGCNW